MQNYPDMKEFDRFFVKLSFKTFLRKGAYSQEEFQDMIAETNFARSDIKNMVSVFRFGCINKLKCFRSKSFMGYIVKRV